MKLKVLLVFFVCLSICRDAYGRASRPDYRVQNCSHQEIRIDFLTDQGESLKIAVIKPHREISLPTSCRRFAVRTPHYDREYMVPAILDVPRKHTTPARPYESMISGKWRLIVSEAATLRAEYLGGGTVEAAPDYTKQPLLFPLRPRRRSETFEQYQAALAAQKRSTLLRYTAE